VSLTSADTPILHEMFTAICSVDDAYPTPTVELIFPLLGNLDNVTQGVTKKVTQQPNNTVSGNVFEGLGIEVFIEIMCILNLTLC